MPLYEYSCPDCGTFEVLQKIDEKPLRNCPQCSARGKKNKAQRLVSAAAFHLKGSGWYKTDYAGSGSSGGGSKSKTSSVERTTTATDSAKAETPCGAACCCKDQSANKAA